MRSQLPILIVGAGPSGLAMAAALAQLKIPFRIIDKKSTPVTGSNATWLQPKTLQFLSALGISDAFLKKGHRCHAITMRVRGKVLGCIPFNQLPSPYPFVLTLPQQLTEELLMAHLERQSVSVERFVHLKGLEESSDCVTAVLESSNHAMERASFSWIVACDGAGSSVRGLCNLAFLGADLPGQFVVADAIMDSFLPSDELHVFFNTGTLCAVFPLSPRHYRVSANINQSHPRKIFTDREVREIVAERTGGYFNVEQVSWISPFWAHSRMIERMRHGRIFFVGDAAHIHSPAGGQGLNSGIQDAANLAFKLALVMHGVGGVTLLDSYHMERVPVLEAAIAQSELFTRVVQSRASIKKKWAELIAPAPLTIPAEIGNQIAQLEVCYTKSPVIDYSGRPDTPAAPQPGKSAPDAKMAIGISLTALQGLLHLVLIFTGGSRDEKWRILQERLQQKYQKYAKVMRVIRTQMESAENVLFDEDGTLHALYHVDKTALYVIRPDGYVAACSTFPDATMVDRVFESYGQSL